MDACGLVLSCIACYLEVNVNSLKALGIIGQLAADVVAVGEDAVEVGPGPLDRHPGGDDQVGHHQLPLPSTHLCLEILYVLAHQDVLQLHLNRNDRRSFTWRSVRVITLIYFLITLSMTMLLGSQTESPTQVVKSCFRSTVKRILSKFLKCRTKEIQIGHVSIKWFGMNKLGYAKGSFFRGWRHRLL